MQNMMSVVFSIRYSNAPEASSDINGSKPGLTLSNIGDYRDGEIPARIFLSKDFPAQHDKA